MTVCSLCQIATAAGEAPAQASRVGQAVSLFLLVGAVLGILIIGVLLITLARHVRREKPSEDADQPRTDPWREAGRRAQPFESDSGEG